MSDEKELKKRITFHERYSKFMITFICITMFFATIVFFLTGEAISLLGAFIMALIHSYLIAWIVSITIRTDKQVDIMRAKKNRERIN